MSPELAEIRAREALEIVGLDYQAVKDRSPFLLSGGQMRRVAIAGVLAMQPKVLILDEPTAGLDPAGKKAILEAIYRIHREQSLTTLLVTHSMEEAARYADMLVVMANGRVVLVGTPDEVFAQSELLRGLGLDVPDTVAFVSQLNRRLPEELRLPASIYREEELIGQLLARMAAVKER